MAGHNELLPTWQLFALAGSGVTPAFMTRARTKPAKPAIGISALVRLEKGLRGLEAERLGLFVAARARTEIL